MITDAVTLLVRVLAGAADLIDSERAWKLCPAWRTDGEGAPTVFVVGAPAPRRFSGTKAL
ncbi:hypothetical protein [Nonomuraea sp. LPB2021202275-12-8]|uniref:hypothetical protein n=1 Tax=Nonomuraea sp. LPB2021202275-12-8 TaxID=3120159 RepID=UPI00300D649C